MKILHSSFSRPFLLLAGSLALVGLAGCGGGNIISPTGANVVISNYAPSSIAGRTITFTDPDQSQFQTVYVFQTSGYTSPNGDSGTYTYQQSSTVNQGSLHLNSSFSPALTYTLTYTSFGGGTYLDQVGKTGPFTMQ